MFSFEHSWALLLIPVVALLFWKFRPSGAFTFSSLRAGQTVSRGRALCANLPNVCVYVSVFIAIIMLANPLGTVEETYKVKLSYRIVAVIDKSGSMTELAPPTGTKISIARKATIDFFKRRSGDLVAILPFADAALFAEGTPFTVDREYVYNTTQAIEPNGSTAIGTGILGGMWYILRDVYVMKHMKESGLVMPQFGEIENILMADNGAEIDKLSERLARQFGVLDGSFIVLVTDGDSNSGVPPEKAISFLWGLRIPVYVIGIGGDVKARPSFAEALENGGGAYFRSERPIDLELMYNRIDALRPTMTKSQLVVEQHSYRNELALVICFLLVIALVTRKVFLVIE